MSVRSNVDTNSVCDVFGAVVLMLNIQRSFRDLSDQEVADIERASVLARIGWQGSFGWSEVLKSRRILLVSEAGTGKTHECQVQQQLLWEAGEPAFFLELATLAKTPVRDMLSPSEEQRLGGWLSSQSETATFFLDSIDELKLTLGSFGLALTRLSKEIAGHLGRARIVITTRPVPVDRQLIEKYLPIPPATRAQSTAEAFADIVMDFGRKEPTKKVEDKAWRNISLMPLSREQMREMAILQNVTDPDALLADITTRDAQEFAERPQDLIEICADWRERQQIRTHRDQVATNIAAKLKPTKTQTVVSLDEAIEGASRLALAAILTRKLTLRYNAESDAVTASEAALDVSKMLTDWDMPSRAALLERPLFGFASYGRVRFHHRSVLEYLAAQRLEVLLARGASIKSVKRLLFVETAQGTRAVRPSMRPVTAWLALTRETVFDEIVSVDPAVALDHGDPQSLRLEQRIRALEAYVAQYGNGGWRGLSTPNIQVHRFACPELSETVKHCWSAGVENPEVRDLLLDIIGAGRLSACSDIAYGVAINPSASSRERAAAIDALVRLKDARLEKLATSLEHDAARWPDSIASRATVSLFPAFLSVQRLSAILRRVQEKPRSIGYWGYRLPFAIGAERLTPAYLDELREALTSLVMEGLSWEINKYPHHRTNRPDLMHPLIAACHRQCSEGVRTPVWLWSCLLVVRLFKQSRSQENDLSDLQRALAELPSDAREAAFWNEDDFLQAIHPNTDVWHRVFELVERGGMPLIAKKDATWVRKCLSDPTAPSDRREMMLWIEMTGLMVAPADARTSLADLKQLVVDAPRLVEIIDNRLRPPEPNVELQQLEAKIAADRKKRENREAKARASWGKFWQQIVADPSKVFGPKQAQNTAWNLWQAMERSGERSRASGWNRRFIEQQFSKEVADRLREAMKSAWRNDKPTLRSERTESEKDRFLVRWQFGLAAIAAEAEDPHWASALTEAEAELACRYAPLELNGFPSWMESLVKAHPMVVERILGGELEASLRAPGEPQSYSMFLQNIRHAKPTVASLFIPRIREWIKDSTNVTSQPDWAASQQTLSQAIKILLELGSSEDRQFLESLATQQLRSGLATPLSPVWLPTLLRLNPAGGVDVLEKGLQGSAVTIVGPGAEWFARLFGRDHSDMGVNVSSPEFTPQLLLRLIRLAYTHVRREDDTRHDGAYEPGPRDHAQEGRNAVLSALLSAKGVEGWNAMIEMANDPLLTHFKDRAIALAQEKAAEEADSTVLTEVEFAVLDKQGEAPPATREDMLALMRDRLDDIDDLLLQDVSPREGWALIKDEHVLRRGLAHELRNLANYIYTVDQEATTADEKETDIRLRAASSSQQATIELKIGEKERSAADLKAVLKDQLVTKYMAADDCKIGCLIISVASDRHWIHPDTRQPMGLDQLIDFLNVEAERLSADIPNAMKLMAKGLDLRPRLPTEKNARSRNR